MMGSSLLWLLSLVSALLLIACVMALTSRLGRFHIRVALPVLSALMVLIVGVGATLFAYKWSAPRLSWLFGYSLSWTLMYLFWVVFFLARGLRLHDRQCSSCRWPRGKLALCFVSVLALCLCTLLILDNTSRIRLTVLQSDAVSVALESLPPRVLDHLNASLTYESAFVAMEEERWPDWRVNIDEPAFDPSKREMKDFLEGKKQAIALLERAAAMPEYHVEINYFRGEVPGLMPYKNAARLLSLNARFKAAHGEVQSALKNIAAIRGMADHLKTVPLVTANLMGAAIQDIGTRTAENILSHRKIVVSEAVKKSLDDDTRPQKAFHRALRMDEAIMTFISTSYLTVRPIFQSVPLGDLLYRALLLNDELTAARKIMLEAQTIAAKPYWQAVDDWDRCEKTVKAFNGLITAISIPSHGRGMETKILEAEAGRRLTNLAFAASAYRADHGIYPAGVEALTPRYITAVPEDPFSGEPLKLASMEGGLMLYSIGPDLKDDGGAREYDVRTETQGVPLGDITFAMGSAFENRRLQPSRERLQKLDRKR